MQTVDQSSRSRRGMHSSSRSDPQPSCTESPAEKELPPYGAGLACGLRTNWYGSLRPRSHLRADAAEPINLDAHDQALLARWAVRVLVHPKESFRECVGVGVGSRLRHRRGAVQDEIRLRFVAVLNGDDDPRVAPEILRLLAPFRRVEQRLIALNVHPDHRHLRSPIRVERDDVAVRLVL